MPPIIGTMRLNLTGIVDVAVKPAITWIRGDADIIVSDMGRIRRHGSPHHDGRHHPAEHVAGGCGRRIRA